MRSADLMNPYQRATAVEESEPGLYRATVEPSWSVRNGPNGGYLAGMLLGAALRAQGEDERSPRSFAVHYLRSPSEGEAQIRVQTERKGRTFSTQTLRFEQDGKLCLLAMLASSDRRDAVEFSHRVMPEVPKPADVPLQPVLPEDPPLRVHFERRKVFGADPWTGAERALSGGWIRLAEAPHGIDPPLLATFCDTWPPAIHSWANEYDQVGGVPTVDLTVHFRRDPRDLGLADDAHALVRFSVHTAVDGYLVEDGEVWSEGGVLLAQARQLGVMG